MSTPPITTGTYVSTAHPTPRIGGYVSTSDAPSPAVGGYIAASSATPGTYTTTDRRQTRRTRLRDAVRTITDSLSTVEPGHLAR